MGFWDFIAPDKQGFIDAIKPWTPAALVVGPSVLDQDTLLELAYYNPASLAGLASRVAYSFSQDRNGTPQASGAAQQALLDNINRGGAQTPSPAIAGSDLTMGHAVGPLVIPNAYEITVKMLCGGRTIDNVFFAYSTTAGQEAAVAAAFQTAWKASGRPQTLLPPAVTLQSFTAVDIRSLTGGQATIFDTTAGGNTGSTPATRAACALVQYNGNVRSRSTRGRTYFGPIASAWVTADGGTLTTGSQTALGTAFNGLVTAMSAAGFPLQVASRKLLSLTPISLVRVSPIIATQRHRLRA